VLCQLIKKNKKSDVPVLPKCVFSISLPGPFLHQLNIICLLCLGLCSPVARAIERRSS